MTVLCKRDHVSPCPEDKKTLLTSSQMRIDAHVPGCSTQTFSFSVRDVLLGPRVSILFCHSEVDHVDRIRSFGTRPTYEEVVGFDVSIYQILLVNCLHS